MYDVRDDIQPVGSSDHRDSTRFILYSSLKVSTHLLVAAPACPCVIKPTLDSPLLNSWLMALPVPGAAVLQAAPWPLPLYWPLWRAVCSRSACRAAEVCSRGCCARLARTALLVLRVLRAVRGGVGSIPSWLKYSGEASRVARDCSDCMQQHSSTFTESGSATHSITHHSGKPRRSKSPQ